MKRQKRTCIYPKDIQIITGRSERYGRKLLREIRLVLDKKPRQFVTIHEFSEYTGIELKIINEYILD
jgi:hypothetical protein